MVRQQHLGVRKENFSLLAVRAIRWVRVKDTVRMVQDRYGLPNLIYIHVYLSTSPFLQAGASFSATCIAKCW